MLLIMPALFPESLGGAERQCQILAPALRRIGWTVDVLSPTTDPEQPSTIDDNGVRISRLFLPHYPNLGGRYLLSFLSWTARATLWIGKRRDQYDVIYVFHARLHAAPAAIASVLFRIPLFIKPGRGGRTFDFVSLREKRFLYGRAVESLIRTANARFVANSPEISGDLAHAKISTNRIALIPNGVVQPSQTETAEFLTGRQGRIFLFAGRLAPEKNVDRLIAAFGQLMHRLPSTSLWIAGDGASFDVLKAQATKLDPTGARIRLLGEVHDMKALYAQSDFFVSASDAEGQSNALLEAMAHANVPIVFEASGTRGLVIEGQSGFLLHSIDPEIIAGVLERAAALDADRRCEMAMAAYSSLAETHGIDAIARRTSEWMISTLRVPQSSMVNTRQSASAV